ncbi:peroxidase 5-like [Actinidia eriantha]|uniref:peroxidase 5-like n=1 Tax=Actinidia eriantha TaxID=165200 RepID=UPI002589E773|nr:peroxidase 5-like [Actinidia eriantha]
MVLPIALFLLLLSLGFQIEAQLQVGFYNDKCAGVETIVRQEVHKAFVQDYGIAPGLIRMHFHDCVVRGCDFSIGIDSTPNNLAEKDGPPNGISLRGFEVIDNAKARLESKCERVVSCADILAFAARDSAFFTGGMFWDVPAGRRDGRVSLAAETIDIPAPFNNLDELTRAFNKKGLTQREMVALSGAHTIGISHCTSFSNRLYNFSSTNSQDPSLDADYAEQLKQKCPRGPGGSIDPNLAVPMNKSPALLDPSYFGDVLTHRGLFTSDQALTTSTQTTEQARSYASNVLAWQADFVPAMIKMSQIEVLTGAAGEIRSNCRRINP